MATVVRFVFNPFQENTYLVVDEATRTCAVIDPGCSSPAEEEELVSYIETAGWQPVLLLNTHAHIDHILGNAFVGKKFGLPLRIHREELAILEAAPQVAVYYGLPAPEPYPADPSAYLRDGEELLLGESRMQVLFTPGHSPGEVCFYLEDEGLLLAGDVLFRESIGRTDLPGGDHATLLRSIRERLLPLPDETRVFPGHGPETTIGHERTKNPFL